MDNLRLIISGRPHKAEYHNCEYCDKPFLRKIKNGSRYCSRKCGTDSQRKRIKLNCSFCNKEFERNPGSMNSKSGLYFCCKECMDSFRRSKNEIYFYELCSDVFNNLDNNEPIFNGWDADIIIHDIKVAVLWNGIWHHKKITDKHSVKQVQNRDKIKIKEIIKYGYEPYVIDDFGKHNKLYVEEKFNEFINHIGVYYGYRL